ncbi:unnamed protein product [Zymoseptoria tritici ST99CH_1A5]|uniref:Uncharacterized protein n=1 Tax=Zymoseptoria tritici ST99CH_1A5 TaxID=1276529 RepID=A0A1Y6LDT8_ZYMTR|nr:unnamed protein product [Zymoseptoria tritici ST99CH_1A5]
MRTASTESDLCAAQIIDAVLRTAASKVSAVTSVAMAKVSGAPAISPSAASIPSQDGTVQTRNATSTSVAVAPVATTAAMIPSQVGTVQAAHAVRVMHV